MDVQHNLLFVYGTLLHTGNPFGAYLNAHSRFLTKGKFRGKLYDIGEYPGALYKPELSSYVYGSVYHLPDAAEVLNHLDEYEGIGPGNPQPYEYSRELITVDTGNEMLNCWAYLYNWPVDKAALIISGDYLAYKT